MKKIHEIVKAQRSFFDSGTTKSVAFRRDGLARLKKAVSARETDIADALYADLGKSAWARITARRALTRFRATRVC